METAAPGPVLPTRPFADRLMGGAAALMIAIAAYLLLFGGGGEDGAVQAGTQPPTLAILTPAGEEVVGGAIRLEFTSSEPLSRGPGGWGTGEHHLHASLGRQEIMPGPESIERLEGSRYRWTMPAPTASTELRLFWSDAEHQPIPESGSAPRPIRIR